jgi:hypothetical protein
MDPEWRTPRCGEYDDYEDDCAPPPPRRMRNWHCYMNDDRSVLTANVEAVTAEDAAVLAADKHRRAGLWTVVPGIPVKVSVSTSTEYIAKRAS